MGVLDKIKNALFEVEYVEVEDAPKKEKKAKPKETEKEEDNDKPIAKKIVLPGRKEEKVEQLEEEELTDEDFEIRPKSENVKEVFLDNFNVMDDDDVTPPTTPETQPEEEVLVPETEAPVVPEYVPETQPVTQPPVQTYQEAAYANKDYVREYDSYREKVQNMVTEERPVKTRESRPYGMDPSYNVSIREYGSENKDDKTYFKPSPIISPIYGILDKNYKKEDVVSKKEIRITSNYTRTNMNVDDIRNKAYGRRNNDEFEEEPVIVESTPVSTPRREPVFEVEEEEENLLVDLSDEKKPEVKEITMGDAMEYFQDLGLEYNVDYVDASSKNPPKKKADDLEEDIKDTMNTPVEEEAEVVEETTPEANPPETTPPETVPVTEPVVEKKAPKVQPPIEKVEEPKKEETPVVEENKSKEESNSTLDDDDNLFDLIDSMYREEDH